MVRVEEHASLAVARRTALRLGDLVLQAFGDFLHVQVLRHEVFVGQEHLPVLGQRDARRLVELVVVFVWRRRMGAVSVAETLCREHRGEHECAPLFPVRHEQSVEAGAARHFELERPFRRDK